MTPFDGHHKKRIAVCAVGLTMAAMVFGVGQLQVASAASPPTGAHSVDPLPTSAGATSNGHSFAGAPGTGTWQKLPKLSFTPGSMLMLTDGTVIVQDVGPSFAGTGNWWRLTPDATGSYVNGSWTPTASMPAGYGPVYYASAVLPDGRVIVEGGEYNLGTTPVWTNQGAIYDPVANTWTPVAPPTGTKWNKIGDASSSVLANGTFMLGGCCKVNDALLNPTTLTWTSTGTGKADTNNEEGWSLLPNGDLLTVDTNNSVSPRNTELYNPSTGTWSSAGVTPYSLVDADTETGPQLLRPNGTVFAAGATGNTAIYNTATGTWSNGPRFPVIGGKQYNVADGPAAVLPNGKVLVDASPGDYNRPAHFFVFNGTTLTQVTDAPDAVNQSSYYGRMLVLPTGQVLFNDGQGHLDVYTDSGASKAKWAPEISSVPTTMAAGGSYTVSGLQLGGLTQGSAYGDDYQGATNYPLVRITNTTTGDIAYAPTSGMTAMSVAPLAASSANFTLPAGIETGASTLAVVANGNASAPVSIVVNP